jgi:hypothetical protein
MDQKIADAIAKAQTVQHPLPESHWFGEKPVEKQSWLIKGVLPQTGVVMIGGQSGNGKTFQAIHLATSLIPDTDKDFYVDRYRIKRKGGVLYLVLEGKAAFATRVQATINDTLGLQMELGQRSKLPFAWNSFTPNLYHEGPDLLIKLVEREAARMKSDFGVEIVVVFLDTMGLCARYDNEDSSAQVLKVLGDLGKASDATGALFIGLDHYGKDQMLGLRGSSAKRDSPETILALLADQDENGIRGNYRMALVKIRDGMEGRIIPYRLEDVTLGVDPDGDPITTKLVRFEPDRKLERQTARRGRPAKQTDDKLEAAAAEIGGWPADPAALRTAYYRLHGGTAGAKRVAWLRAKAGLRVCPDGRLDVLF